MSDPNYLKLLSDLCIGKIMNDEVEHYSALDTKHLSDAAIEHGVTHILESSLKHQTLQLLPNLYHAITQFNQHQIVAVTFFDNEAQNVLSLLVSDNIEFVVLKGFALARTVYPSSNMRTKADVDILISPEQVESVKSVFAQQGYTNPRGWEPKAIINQFSMRKVISKDLKVDFDIHLKISNNKRLENVLALPQLLSASQLDTQTQAPLVGNVHALIHAVFHLMNHRSNGDLIKLIWYYDIHLLVNKLQKSEQQQLLEWVHASGLSKVLIKALALTAEYFDSTALQSINIKVDSKQSSTEFDLLLSINSKKVLFGEGLNSQKTLKDKWLFIQEMAFPPPAEIYAKYGKDNKQPLVWLYLRRIGGGVVKTLKG